MSGKLFQVSIRRQVTIEARLHPVPCVRLQLPEFMFVDGIQFQSPEEFMDLVVGIMEKMKEVWPDNPVVKMYTEDE